MEIELTNRWNKSWAQNLLKEPFSDAFEKTGKCMLDNNWNNLRKWFADMWVVSSESPRHFEEIVKHNFP